MIRYPLFWLLLAMVLARPAESRVILYSSMDYDAPVARAFTRATGIPVTILHLHTGPLLARVEAEGARSHWDALWFDGSTAMESLATQHLLRCGTSPAGSWNTYGRALLPPDRCYVPTGFTYAGVFVVRRGDSRTAPASWTELQTHPHVGINDPAISAPAYATVAGIMKLQGSVAAGKTYFRDIKAHGLKVFPTNGATLHALLFRQIDVAVVQSSAAVTLLARGAAVRILYPRPVTLLPSDLALARRAPPGTGARRFQQFVLSAAGQAVMRGAHRSDSNYYPVVRGARALADLPPPQESYQVLDARRWSSRSARIAQWFARSIAWGGQ